MYIVLAGHGDPEGRTDMNIHSLKGTGHLKQSQGFIENEHDLESRLLPIALFCMSVTTGHASNTSSGHICSYLFTTYLCQCNKAFKTGGPYGAIYR